MNSSAFFIMMECMSEKFILTLNNQIIYTYNKMRIPGLLLRFLEQMDRDMDVGIQLGEYWVQQADEETKIRVVAMMLFNAIEQHDTNQMNVMSAYLLNRNETLVEIKVNQQDDCFNLQIINT